MPTYNQDYILRQIEMISEMIARALGLKLEHKFDAALDTLKAALGKLLGTEVELLEMVDAQTAARLIGDPRKIKAYADILAAKADVLAGDLEETKLRTRAEILTREAEKSAN